MDLPQPGPTEPTPIPTNPQPGQSPIEVDTGDLHSKPNVDYDTIPQRSTEPMPDIPNEPEKPTEPNRETPAPPTEPGH
ncbi:MAG: hypothetical protein NDI69_07655 [Bacteriovoracaceae bacterium]|nr:hypothetical protein [Bacteriovoracaceae bacterium]